MQMFKGNIDGDSIRRNVFEVPIIAQWIRINPTRWRERISLRVELYGCDYSKQTFRGEALVVISKHKSSLRKTLIFQTM